MTRPPTTGVKEIPFVANVRLQAEISGRRVARSREPDLSALGVAIGIASMVAVLGVSESSKADLLAALDHSAAERVVVEHAEPDLHGSDRRELKRFVQLTAVDPTSEHHEQQLKRE